MLRAVKVRGARTGKGDSEVIEEALRRELGLGLLERLWQGNDLSEEEATVLAVLAQHWTRRTVAECEPFLDPNMLISALLSRSGAPAQLLEGEAEFLVRLLEPRPSGGAPARYSSSVDR